MVQYENTKIYFIRVGDKRYFGHTAEEYLSVRESRHKSTFKIGSKCKVYEAIREAGMSADEIVCVWVEDYPCNSKNEAKARERWWIEHYGELNTQIPLRTPKEYYEQNKDKIKEYRERNKDKIKEYYERNKDKIVDKKKEYYERNKDKIKEYYERNKDKLADKHKEYYERNKDKLADKRKEYYEHNKDKIAEYQKEYYERNKDKVANFLSLESPIKIIGI